ncbi:hypothetical protein DRQ36_09610 [bacterium]|nr:MAG: hypothetical protein DRQ36_09610 [bacterium]
MTFPATTTGGWPTVDFRDWIPLDKYITAVIVYGQPITATTTAGMIVWRGYTLMGVPLNPWEDTNAYQTFADAYIPPCPYTLPLDPGDQDAVLYDDFHTNCSGVPADSNCGKYENWWRVSKYYPQIDGYRRFTEPGVYYGDGGVEPFSPGLGYWLIQDHCSEVRIDVYGTMVDTTSSYPIGLARNNSASYSCYNIVANPFYDPSESRHMPVFWRDAEVWKFEDVAPTDGEAGTLSVTAAAAAGWIEGAAQAYRDGSYRPLDPFEGTERDTLYEWEGFWVKTGNADAEDVGDSLVLLMNARPGGARRARPSPEQELLSFWKVRFGADCEELLQKDQNNFLGYKEYNTDVAVRCFGVYEMPDYTYPEPWLRVYFTDDSGEELQELYEDERQSITVWNAVLDCRSVKGEKVRVNWNAGDIPEGFELHLKDPDHDEWIDMLAQSEYYFISTGKKHNVEIIAEAPLEWVTKEVAETPQIPEEFYLADPTPNPFNASCRVEFGLANGDGGHINISVYNINGRKVNTLVDADLDPGFYHFTWDGNDAVGNRASSGMYLVRFTGAGRDITHKVSLIK